MIVANTPTVQIAGKPPPNRGDVRYENGVSTYKMRRLSTRDTFRLIQILEVGARASNTDLRQLDVAHIGDGVQIATTFGQLIFTAMSYASDDIISFCASLIGVEPRYFDDGEHFPMGSEFEIITALPKHPDAEALLKTLGNALRGMQPKAHAPPSQEPSTESQNATGGLTTPS